MNLQTILFGSYQPPAIPGRFHTLNEQPNAREIAARNRKLGQRASPKRDAIMRYLAKVEWASVRQIAKAVGCAHPYVQKVMAASYEEEQTERRRVAGSHNEHEYRLKVCA